MRGAAAFLTFDRPAARNAMTWAMYEQLARAVEELEARRDVVRVVVLRGAGASFVSGTDIAQFTEFRSGDDGLAYERRLEAIVARLEALPLPTIAAIEGHAAGAGLILATVCDIRICTPSARFGVPIARTVGNSLTVANHARLVSQLGASRTKALLMTAGFMTAGEASAAGFVLEVVPDERWTARVDELAATVAALAPITLRATKRAVAAVQTTVLAAPTRDVDEEIIRDAYASRDFREGVTAFLEKRAPRWEGR
jgi:enoyl-CoA hydratase/carnithine racemase